MAQALTAARVALICVSRSHASALRTFLLNRPLPFIDFIHNPIADDLTPDATAYDPNRLLFASSPHKGLAQVFAQFRTARDAIPSLTLAVADPGYLAWDTGPVPDGVTFLGALPHAALIAQMRRSLCLFYPQTTFAETFGLVMAEANAVGLPVLAHHGIGANAEVLGDTEQVVDGTDPDQIVARIRTWRSLRPKVAAQPHFRLAAVAKRWSVQLDLSCSAGSQTGKVV
nr:glycosyltransferase family 4 protein [Loktanella sp. M215]